MTEISKLWAGYQKFHQKYFVDNPQTYEKLTKDGQAPKTLVIACSDSRVDPSIILNTEPGDIFVIRNVANLVPPYEDDMSHCHGTSAAIEYAVRHLNVENIIVLGHKHCGGVASLVNEKEHDHTFIDTWLSIALQAKEKALTLANQNEDVCSCCEKEVIKISLNNLKTFPFIQDKLKSGKLELHGWYFCLESGNIEIIS